MEIIAFYVHKNNKTAPTNKIVALIKEKKPPQVSAGV